MTLLSSLLNRMPEPAAFLEIGVLWVILFYLLRLLRGTRGAQVMTGLVVLMALILVLTRVFNLYTLNWIFTQFSLYIVVAFIVIFQPEIRGMLADIGRRQVFVSSPDAADIGTVVEQVAEAAHRMAEGKIGALIALERETGMRAHQETGRPVDAQLSADLLCTLFFPRTPLHDGAVIVKDGRIAAAGCVFPLTQNPETIKSLGTRHRAAIGITEETDAVVVVVSEETGAISLAYRGRLTRGLDRDKLRRILSTVLRRKGSLPTAGTPGAPAPLSDPPASRPKPGRES